MHLRWRHVAAAAVVVALAASATSLGSGFTFDDRPLIAENPRVHSLGHLPALFGETYWPERNGAALYRPLTLALFSVQWAIGGGSPLVFHAANVLLYAGVCVAVAALLVHLLTGAPANTARQQQGLLIAIAAATLFAAHPVHVEAVGNIVGQSELVVALLLSIAMTLYLRARAVDALTRPRMSFIVVLYVVACMAKEHAVVFPALLLAAELTVLRQGTRIIVSRANIAAIAATGAAGVAFLAVRSAVVGGFTGEFAHRAWGDATASDRVLTMLRVVPEWTRLLLWPARLSADYSPRQIEVVHEFTSTVFTGVLVLAAVVAIAVLSWRRWPLITFGILWCAIALLPVSNLFVATGVLLAERTLFLSSIGVIIAAAGVFSMIGDRLELPESARWHRRAAAAALVVLVLAGTVRSALRQRVWRDNPTFFAQMLEDAPLSYRAHWARGAQLFDAGKKAEGELELRLAAELFPRDPDLIEDLASRYLRAGLCVPAVPRFRQVLEMVPDRSTARMGLVACLLRDGQHELAATEARAGLRFGADSAQLTRLAHIADSLKVAQ